jgi:phi13 family phage major tail protein
MSAQQKSTVGLRDLYYALVTQDDASAYAADTPAIIAPAIAASHRVSKNSKIQYADDGVFDQLTTEGPTDIEMEVTGIPLSVLAVLLGKEYDAATGRMFDNPGAIAPDVAVGFRSKKSNGSYKYFWYLKGKFAQPDEEQATESDTPDLKTAKIVFSAVKTAYQFDLGDINDGVKRVVGDTDISGFSATSWFTAVQVPVAGSPSAFTCTPSPADDAEGVDVDTAIVLTFSNPLSGGAESHVELIQADTTDTVAIVASMNAARTVMTILPSSPLIDSETPYNIVLAGVMDVYGQYLHEVYSFTTEA